MFWLESVHTKPEEMKLRRRFAIWPARFQMVDGTVRTYWMRWYWAVVFSRSVWSNGPVVNPPMFVRCHQVLGVGASKEEATECATRYRMVVRR